MIYYDMIITYYYTYVAQDLLMIFTSLLSFAQCSVLFNGKQLSFLNDDIELFLSLV